MKIANRPTLGEYAYSESVTSCKWCGVGTNLLYRRVMPSGKEILCKACCPEHATAVLGIKFHYRGES